MEKVLKRSKSPKTDWGRRAVPIGPNIMRNRVIDANIPRLPRPAFLDERDKTTREESESSTTDAVTVRCIKF